MSKTKKTTIKKAVRKSTGMRGIAKVETKDGVKYSASAVHSKTKKLTLIGYFTSKELAARNRKVWIAKNGSARSMKLNTLG